MSALAVAVVGPAPMTTRLRDTLSGETRPLEPLEAGHVRIYSCGPTVYGPVHIGNFRSFLYADVLVRYLRYRGLRVTWVMNITDVDDKIIRGAAAAGIGIDELADTWLERFLADADALRMTRPDVLPRATGHIDDMVRLIEALLERGHAYRTDDGSIFFRISSWPAYGQLAHLDPEQMRVGERVEADEYGKDDVRDFAALEGPEAGRAFVGHRDRAGPAGLAYRVLGDVDAPPRRVVRHPHRRRRPRVPAPRGRDRPERGRDRQAVRPDLAALRPPADERREDGEVDRATSPASARCSRPACRPAGAPLRADRGPLPGGTQLHADSLAAAAAAVERLDALLAALGGIPRGPARRPDAARRCSRRRGPRSTRRSTTTSTSRRRWRRCSTWSASSTGGSTRGRCRPRTRRAAIDWLRTTDAVLGVLPDEADDLEPRAAVAARRPRRGARGTRLGGVGPAAR